MAEMTRPTVATVHLDAIQHNLLAIQNMLGSTGAEAPVLQDQTLRSPGASAPGKPSIIAVVKANAYGHGAARVAGALEAAGASMFACADLEEGVALREAGITRPILVFGALSVSDLSCVFTHDLTPTVSTPSAARALEAAAEKHGRVIGCHLKIDTGMNRLGFRHDNLGRTLPEVLSAPHLRIDAVYTHFATADRPESPWMEEQRRRFDHAMAALGAMGLRNVRRHAANSAALLRDARTWYDAVRPGLLLYGIVPPPLAAANLDLRPALSLSSRIVAVKGLRPGEGTGYGLRWQEDRARTIAIVPAGYADGLDIRLANHGHVLVRGKRRPIVGAMNMDMMMIEVTGEDVSPGDEVVLIGKQGAEEITAREIAATIGSIPWEVVCRLGSRIERVY
jgi:alanine racemase